MTTPAATRKKDLNVLGRSLLEAIFDIISRQQRSSNQLIIPLKYSNFRFIIKTGQHRSEVKLTSNVCAVLFSCLLRIKQL